MKIEIPQFETQKELFAFLIDKKDVLESQKKSAIKYADGVGVYLPTLKTIEGVDKASASEDKTEIKVKAIINTTNLLDSHGDVHIKGLWSKSIRENKRMLHVQEHQSSSFDKIIASGDDLRASTKTYSWKELGYDAEGQTQALVFDSNVKQDRNSFMFEQYSKGFVDNHSVGMRYVKMELAVNDEDYAKEKEVWDKYIGDVANSKDAVKQGYFWAVTEAKAIEGSAVPMGSNPITPTMSAKSEVEATPQKSLEELRNEAIMKWLKK